MEINSTNLEKNCEQWASIDGYRNYEVSFWGRVRNTDTGRILKAGRGINSYWTVILCKEGKRKNHSVHALVAREWVPNPDNKRCVDHIDGDRLNNHHENLRFATHMENMRNRAKHKNGLSAYKGISFHRNSGKWQARILLNRVNKILGYYKIEREAAEAYNAAAIEFYKEFARVDIFED